MSKSKWRDHQTANEIIERISRLIIRPGQKCNAISTHKNYNSAFNTSGLDTLETLLKDNTRFNPEIPENLKQQIITKSIFESADKENLHSGYISEAIKRMESEYLSKEKTEFILLTRVTINSLKRKKIVKTPNSTIAIHREIPKKFKYHYDFSESKLLHPNTNERAYSWATIQIQSRCSHSAADKALQELNFWIGILNIFYNHNQNRISFSIPQPINKIRSFPYHSLHLESGEKATTAYWYNLNHSVNGTSIQADETFNSAMAFFNKTKIKIIKTKKYDLFLGVLNRYCDSLETSDMNRSFLGLWSLLEQITFTGNNTYDVTINRALFIFKDKFLTTQILETLRNKRNMAILIPSANIGHLRN